jgi:hypothetical protein
VSQLLAVEALHLADVPHIEIGVVDPPIIAYISMAIVASMGVVAIVVLVAIFSMMVVSISTV